jgi:hypothetical protein
MQAKTLFLSLTCKTDATVPEERRTFAAKRLQSIAQGFSRVSRARQLALKVAAEAVALPNIVLL